MPVRVWLALPLLASLFAAACSSTTENHGSGGSSSGGASGAGPGGAPSGGGAKGFVQCVDTCDASTSAGQAFKKELTTCACLTSTTCNNDCATFCTGTPPTLACFLCPDTAKTACLANNCTGDCESYRTCLATCASKL